MNKIIVSAALFVLSITARAAEPVAYAPFAEAKVSPAQVEQYRTAVHKAFGSSLRAFPAEHLEVLHSPDLVLHFAFTTPGHPAHPAWITRRVADGSVNQIGYFAGDEPPFAELFQAYRELTNRNIESADEEDAPEKSASE